MHTSSGATTAARPCCAGPVDAPDAPVLLVHQRPDLRGAGLEGIAPELGGALVVAAQVFHVQRLQPAFLQRAQHGADVRQLAAREHVAVDEGAAAVAGLAVVRVGAGDAVVHGPALGLEQAADVAEIGCQVVQPHVLEHAHAGDAVERPVGHVAVVLQPDLDAILQASLAHPLGRQRELVLRQRHAHAARAKVPRRAQHQRPPATADVQQALAGLQPDLAQDVVDLLLLRLRQGLVAVLEIGAGIDHGRVQPLRVERVGDVVVVPDGLAVARSRVAEAAADAAQQTAFGPRAGRQPMGHAHDVGQRALDVDQALDIGLPQSVQAGLDQQRPGRRLAHPDLHRRRLAQRQRRGAAVTPAQPHRHIGLAPHPFGPGLQGPLHH